MESTGGVGGTQVFGPADGIVHLSRELSACFDLWTDVFRFSKSNSPLIIIFSCNIIFNETGENGPFWL